MSTSVSTANSILDLIYLATAWADMAENDGVAPATNIDIALHTAAPASSAQTSNEATYTGYARVPVLRNATGWDAASAAANANAALIQFAECTAGANTITYVSVGNNDIIIFYGALAAARAVSAGIQPQFADGALVTTIT
jgi:hypothetical protein